MTALPSITSYKRGGITSLFVLFSCARLSSSFLASSSLAPSAQSSLQRNDHHYITTPLILRRRRNMAVSSFSSRGNNLFFSPKLDTGIIADHHHPADFFTQAILAPFGVVSMYGSALSQLFSSATSSNNDDTKDLVEVQILNDMIHGLDLAAFLLGPGALVLRAAAVVGRLFTVAADYIPDGTIHPEEMIFQAVMLVLAVGSLVRAATIPYVASAAPKPTLRDGKTFRALFAPAGVSWSQYKALTVFAFEWMTLSVGDQVNVGPTTLDGDEEEDCMYWLYSGRVQVETSSEKPVYIASRDNKKDRLRGGEALIGERQLLQQVMLQQSRNRHSNKKKRTTTSTVSQPVKESIAARVVSPEGAMVLRINIPGLKTLMNNDPDLEHSIRNLLFQAMEAKMSTYWTTKQGDDAEAAVVPTF